VDRCNQERRLEVGKIPVAQQITNEAVKGFRREMTVNLKEKTRYGD